MDLAGAVAVLVALWVSCPARAVDGGDGQSIRVQAAALEAAGLWQRAFDLYDQILARDPRSPQVRRRYRICLRHVLARRRHDDSTFTEQVAAQGLSASLAVYGEVLTRLQTTFVDPDRVLPSRLFRSGLDELSMALADPAYRAVNIPSASDAAVAGFRARLAGPWGKGDVRRSRVAQAQALDVALAAQKALGLKPTTVVWELIAGACADLDEYSYFLTPSQLSAEAASLEGETIGVGMTLENQDGHAIIADVVPGGPAAVEGLHAGDEVLRIDGRAVDGLGAESVTSLLDGRLGAKLRLEIRSPGRNEPREVWLTRRAVRVPSVVDARLRDDQPGVAYCRLTAFRKTTPLELDEALAALRLQGMRALVLDLRGNSGGLLDSAVAVAGRFRPDGVITTTETRMDEYRRTYRVRTPDPLSVPLVLLTDGGTASAAEILAGGLKDHERAVLVGQTTFGKGSVQGVLPLAGTRAAVRVTLARFFSPRAQPYTGQGVTPHIVVDRVEGGLADSQLDAAVQEAARLMVAR